MRLVPDGPVHARLEVADGAPVVELAGVVRHMLRLDEDMSAFYAVAAADPELEWVVDGAGRMLRSPTVFEDLVKTICTTNCTWSATVRMVTALVTELGQGTFPTPAVMAAAGDDFYVAWPRRATAARTCGRSRARSPRGGSISRRWPIRRSATRR